MFEVESGVLNGHSRLSPALAQRLSCLIVLLVVALMTISCGMPAHAAATQPNLDSLNVFGVIPSGTVDKPYSAVLVASGGSAPYYYSVKTGVLPPGVSLNPATGTISGKPTSAGNFTFEVIVTDSPLFAQGSQSFSLAVSSGSDNGGSVQVSVSPTT